MPQSLYPPVRPLAIGEVLDLAFLIFKVTLVRCLPYGVFAMIAGQLPNIYDLLRGTGAHRPFGGGDPIWIALYIIGIVLMLVAWSALLLRQRAIVEHKSTAVSLELAATLRRLPSFLGASLCVAVAVCGEFSLLVLIPPPHRIAALLPLLLLSLYLGVLLSCTWPAVLFMEKGPLEALRYSVMLVLGNWWRVAMVYAVGFAVVVALGVVVAMIIPIVVPAIGVDIAVVTAVLTVVLSALGALAAPFFGSLLLAVCGDLRVRRQGIDLLEPGVDMAVE